MVYRYILPHLVELVKYVVKQQYRGLARMLCNYLMLSQFECNYKGLLLPLRAILSKRYIANGKVYIIAVNTHCCMT